jgi:hypothetical protein
MRRRTSLYLAVLAVLAAGPPAFGETIELNFNQLPSAQNPQWTYFQAGAPNGLTEKQVFSVDGTSLHQDTYQYHLFQLAGSANWYQLQNVVNLTQPFLLTVRVRVTQEETLPNQPDNHFGFFLSVDTGTETFAIGIGTHGFEILRDSTSSYTPPANIDNTTYHTYAMRSTPGGSFTITYDGSPLFAGTPSTFAGFQDPNGLYFGDGTGGSNAAADMTTYEFIQPIPEPATGTLLGLGGIGLVGLGWKRRRRHSSGKM